MKHDKCIILLVGATGGIGAALARECAERKGAVLILAGRSRRKLLHVQESCKRKKRIQVMVCDVCNEHSVEKMVDSIIKRYGRIDVLINCAGKFLARPVEETSIHEWSDCLDTNAKGMFLLVKYIVPVMKQAKKGMVIALSSIGGVRGLAGKSAYCASKHALVGFLRSVSREVKKDGIKVHIIHPFLVDSRHEIAWDIVKESELTIMRVEDIAQIVKCLLDLPRRVDIEELEVKPLLY